MHQFPCLRKRRHLRRGEATCRCQLQRTSSWSHATRSPVSGSFCKAYCGMNFNCPTLSLLLLSKNCSNIPVDMQARPSSALAGEGGWLLAFVPDGKVLQMLFFGLVLSRETYWKTLLVHSFILKSNLSYNSRTQAPSSKLGDPNMSRTHQQKTETKKNVKETHLPSSCSPPHSTAGLRRRSNFGAAVGGSLVETLDSTCESHASL